MSMLGLIAASLVSGAFGNAQQRSYLDAQSKENYLAFQRNKELAELQNNYNIEQWNRENAYNLPVNQMQRLKDAGINPHLAFSNGVSGLTSANSPSMSAGSPYTPVDYTMNGNRRTIGDTINQSLDLAMKKAQIDNINSITDKNKKETEGLVINLETLSDMNSAELRLKLSEVGMNEEQVNNFIKEREVMDATIADINSKIDERYANIANMSVQQLQRSIELKIQQNLTDATIAKLRSETGLTVAQIYRIATLLPSELSNLKESTDLITAQKNLAIAQEANVKEDTNNKKSQNDNIKASTDLLKSQKELNDKEVKIKETERLYYNDAFRIWQDFTKVHKISIVEKQLLF